MYDATEKDGRKRRECKGWLSIIANLFLCVSSSFLFVSNASMYVAEVSQPTFDNPSFIPQEKALTLENAKKNELFFVLLLAYSYL